MITLPSYIWFWIFIIIFLIIGVITPLFAYILVGKTGGDVKEDSFECGQEIDIRPLNIRIAGAMRYFAYAVAFFVLDALSWILMASVYIPVKIISPIPIVIYIAIIAIGIVYFLKGISMIRG